MSNSNSYSIPVTDSKKKSIVESITDTVDYIDENGDVRIDAASGSLPAVGSGSLGGSFTGGHEGKGAAGWGSSGGINKAGQRGS